MHWHTLVPLNVLFDKFGLQFNPLKAGVLHVICVLFRGGTGAFDIIAITVIVLYVPSWITVALFSIIPFLPIFVTNVIPQIILSGIITSIC